jgi:hypothetical protein
MKKFPIPERSVQRVSRVSSGKPGATIAMYFSFWDRKALYPEKEQSR